MLSYVASCDPLKVAARAADACQPRHNEESEPLPPLPSLAMMPKACHVDAGGFGVCMRMRTTSTGLNTIEPIEPVIPPARILPRRGAESSCTASRTVGYRPMRNPVYESPRIHVASRPGCQSPMTRPSLLMSDDASWYVDGAPPPPIPPVPAAAAAAGTAAGDAPASNTCLLTFSTSSGLKSVSASAQPTPAENHSSATRGTLTLVPEVTNELEELLLPLNEFEEPPTTAMTKKMDGS